MKLPTANEIVVALMTADSPALRVAYAQQAFDDSEAELPEQVRLMGEVAGRLVRVLDSLRAHPQLAPFVEEEIRALVEEQ